MPTVLHRLHAWAEATPDQIAQRFRKEGAWREITIREVRNRVYWLALYLQSRGLNRSEAGVIFSYNSPEWVQTDLATLLLGARSAGLYPNSNAKDIEYIVNHTEATVLSVQDAAYFKKIERLPERVRLILVFNGDTSIHPKAVSFWTAIEEGRRIAEGKGAPTIEALLSEIDPKAGAFMIYTSGTTGNPKGALLSHDNLAYTSDMAIRYWKMPFNDGSMFSFLPLCHIAEKLQNIGVGISARYTVSFATSIDNLKNELPEVEPTLLLCVPRLWEKMMEGVMTQVRAGKGAKKTLALWAFDVGSRVAEAKFSGRYPSLPDRLQYELADRLVLSKVRKKLGLGKAQLLASGAAALPAHVSRWFRSLGLEILEDFGQTESTGVICMTEVGVDGAGTVGKPVPGTEFRLAEDGEILTRGRHVFVGYFKEDKATAEALKDGWLHTGDLGEWNEKGQLKIRGRKKEIMKSSGGKMIAPLPIEERIKAADAISQACMVGDGRKYFSILITLSEAKMAELNALPVPGHDGDKVTHAGIVEEVGKVIAGVNSELASYEQIKRFTIIPREFSVIDGEMTPTLKMKRAVIEARFKHLIDAMYQGGGDA
jgi:long-chain acyl-CoA synthetase